MALLPTNLRPKTLEKVLVVIEQLLQIITEQQARILAFEARVAGSRWPARGPLAGRRAGGQPGREVHQGMLYGRAIVPVKPRRADGAAGDWFAGMVWLWSHYVPEVTMR